MVLRSHRESLRERQGGQPLEIGDGECEQQGVREREKERARERERGRGERERDGGRGERERGRESNICIYAYSSIHI
jgi:hypothetical protein